MSEATKKEMKQKHGIGKKYMRAKEVSAYISCGLSTVWMYAKQGRLTPIKISERVTVFSIAEIDKLFAVEVA